jgi:hypothetical protein
LAAEANKIEERISISEPGAARETDQVSVVPAEAGRDVACT